MSLLDVFGFLGGTPHPSSRPKPVHPRLLAQSKESREADEVGKLIAAGYYQQPRKPNTTPLRQPNIQVKNATFCNFKTNTIK